MFSVDFDTKQYQACYNRELLPSQIPEIFDISKILENIEQSEKEQNQESYAGKRANFETPEQIHKFCLVVYIYCFLLIFGIVCNLIILLVTVWVYKAASSKNRR